MGYIDKTGKTAVSPKYAYAGNFTADGLAVVGADGKYGYIDITGKEIAAPAYEKARDFSGGVAAVCQDGKWGFIDKTGKALTPFEYDGAADFVQNAAIVRKGSRYGIVNVTVGGFSDVLAGSPYAQPIDWAVGKGITNGTSPTTFSPDQPCSTAQILTFMWRAMGSPEPANAVNPYANIKADDYFYKAVLWAREKGLISGGAFDPNAPCTRASTATYLWKLAGSPAAQGAGFSDVPAGAAYAQAVAWAVSNGITNGTSATTFSPGSICTRGQIMTFLYRDLA